YAFMMVAIAVMMLRKSARDHPRSFRTPMLWLIGPLTIAGCVFLFFNLPMAAMLVLPIWGAVGILIYFLYGYRTSHVGRGLSEVHETELGDLQPPIPGVDEAR
ncbi:MAG: amino acid permease, partial [Allosphingosinicella sp.]